MNDAERCVLSTLTKSSVFITGASGFVGKVLVEKLLRCVPNIGTMYLLVRPRKGQSAQDRMREEIVQSQCFDRLRREIGVQHFLELTRQKLRAVSGDLVQSQLGIDDAMQRELCANVQVIWHSAAAVDFNLRLDDAIELNVKGTLRVLDLAKRCSQLRAFVHVSTSFVNCTRVGFVEERLYPIRFNPSELLAQLAHLNVVEMQKVAVDGVLGEWPNTYTFTKFITEYLLRQRRGNVPVAIVRPSIVGAAWREPVPGWVDCISAAGAVYIAVGLGVLRKIHGISDNIADIVPVDFVVNCLILAVPTVIERPDLFFVCHAATSTLKPYRWASILRTVLPWIQAHPIEGRISDSINCAMVSNPAVFELYMFLRYSLPSSILSAISFVGTAKQKKRAALYEKLASKVRLISDAFNFFTMHEWRFEACNTMSLLDGRPEHDRQTFWLSLNEMNPASYHENFFYGLLRFVLNSNEMVAIDNNIQSRRVCLNRPEWLADQNVAVTRWPWIARLLAPDLSAVAARMSLCSTPGSRISIESMHATVLASSRVQTAIDTIALQTSLSRDTITNDAIHILSRIVGDTRLDVLTGMGVMLRKLFRHLYDNVFVNMDGIERVHAAQRNGHPIVYVPTHRSYVDFLVVSYMCSIHTMPMPFVAATEDFLGVFIMRWLFRHSGAFFLRRTHTSNKLYRALFSEYVLQLLSIGQALEFFIEGTRSRSGKMLHPRMGLLSMITNAVRDVDIDVDDVSLIPISISYEHVLEGGAYPDELLGASKIQESLRNLARAASSVLASNFGRISVLIGDGISVRDFVPCHRALNSTENKGNNSENNNDDNDGGGGMQAIRAFNWSLAYRLSYELTQLGEIMPTHMVASLLLMYRQGLSRVQLKAKVQWLMAQIRVREGRLALVEAERLDWIVDKAIVHLLPAVVERRKHVYEPNIMSRGDLNNMLLLGHYRNKMIHVFFRESIWACALHSLGDEAVAHGTERQPLFEAAALLYSLLQREIIDKPDPSVPEDFNASFETMLSRGVFRLKQCGRVEVVGEVMFSFLCSLCWPFIDSYFVVAMTLHTLEQTSTAPEATIVQRAQWLGTTLYHESMMCYFESLSSDTIRNAISTMQLTLNVVVRTREVSKPNVGSADSSAKPVYVLKLTEAYQDGALLQQLIHRLDVLRKRPPVVKSSLRRSMIAEIPALARL